MTTARLAVRHFCPDYVSKHEGPTACGLQIRPFPGEGEVARHNVVGPSFGHAKFVNCPKCAEWLIHYDKCPESVKRSLLRVACPF